MSQPPYQPPPYGQQPYPPRPPMQPVQQMPPGKPPKKKRFGWLALIIASLVALFLGAAVGGAAGGAATTTAAPAVTVTATETETVEVPAEEPADEPTVEPEPEPTEEPAGFKPRKKDWRVKVKITDKQCFGSAGCSLDYKINPQYVGSQSLPDTGVIEVTYEITGDEDPIVGSFTIESGQVEYDEEGFMSTPRSSTKVKATITDVEYDENA